MKQFTSCSLERGQATTTTACCIVNCLEKKRSHDDVMGHMMYQPGPQYAPDVIVHLFLSMMTTAIEIKALLKCRYSPACMQTVAM